MLSNFFWMIIISSIILSALFLFHIKFRTYIENKYPTIIKLSENGKSVVHIYVLTIAGVFRYGKYEFSVKDRECKENLLSESLLLAVGYVFILYIVNLFLYADFSENITMIIVNTLIPDVVFFGLLFRGKHQAYTALKIYLLNGHLSKDTEFLYDNKQASIMYMAGLEADVLRTSFPLISDDEIAHIEKDGDDKKLHQFIRKSKKLWIIFGATLLLTILAILPTVVFNDVCCLGFGILAMFLEGVLSVFFGLHSCPYCGKDFGFRRGPGLYCDHCKKPLTEQTKRFLEFLEDNEEDDEEMKQLKAELKNLRNQL